MHSGKYHLGHSHNNKQPQTMSVTDYSARALSQNIAVCFLDKNVESMEDQALFSLTDIMQGFISEVAKDTKNVTELQGRTESNLIDLLTAMQSFYFNKSQIRNYIEKECQKSEMRLNFNQAELIS